MDNPNDSEERQEWPISRSFSPVPWPLDFRGTPYPSFTHHLPGPHQPPPLGVPYEIPARAAEFRAIRPFRLYNYLGSPGEDLSARLYTLGRDNLWEANDDLTREYGSLAQRARQFTSVHQPSAHWNPHEMWRPGGQGSHSQLQLYEDVRVGSAGSNHTPPYYQPPGPDILPSSPRAPNTSPVAGPSTEPAIASNSQLQRRRGSSLSDSKEKKEWFCELCNFGPFFRKAEYDRHVKTSKAHKRQRSYEWDFRCSKCGRSFTRSDAKTRHEKLCDLKGNGRESEGNDN
ncbi:hypothetical protein FS749_013482 [Ceratobasidium sp. UAMH 11750]|nr:hypothetical protein FS749_013482 [Ceratobasidium sp. UAMH 11750]